VERTIAAHIRDLIPDEAPLQIGIGSIPTTVLRELGTKNDLGLQTEMFSDGVLPLLHDGVITNTRTRALPGVSTTGFVVGTSERY
jgi:acyl-CoA hydrolase